MYITNRLRVESMTSGVQATQKVNRLRYSLVSVLHIFPAVSKPFAPFL